MAEAANYTFDPARFPTSPEARVGTGKLTLQPGPNNPVGTTWIGLNRDGYGIHGTVEPDSIGANQSMGCIRLLGPDVERVYDALTTEGSMITISP